MYILTFFIVFAVSQFLTNKILNVSDENKISYSYSRKHGLIIFGFLITGILLQVFAKFEGQVFWIIMASYAFAILMTMIVLASIKKVIVAKQNEEREKIFDVIKPVLGLKKGEDEFDPARWEEYNIELGYDKNQVNRITIKINPDRFKLDQATNLCMTLNLYLPDYEWLPEPDLPARKCSFVGAPLPPHVARYKGSWLRPAEFIPIGLTGLGELAWVINSYKGEGRSLYIYDDGKRAKTVDSPSAPQALVVGGTGGGKSIYIDQEVDVED